MGSTYRKVTYKCDCGKDYGSCGEEGVFFLEYNRSCDIGTIFWKPHPGEKMQHLAALTDDQTNALIKLLTTSDSDLEPAMEFLNEIKEARGW